MPDKILKYCEQHGIYEIYKIVGDIITYYSYYGSEGFYKITHDIDTGKETRRHLKYKKTPKFLITETGSVRYNYFCG